MSKRFIISESERKNIISAYSNKGILLETNKELKSKEVSLDFSYYMMIDSQGAIFLKDFYFLPYLGPESIGDKFVQKFRISDESTDSTEKIQKLLNYFDIKDYKPENIKFGDVFFEFKKVSVEPEKFESMNRSFMEYETKNSTFSSKPFFVLTKQLINGNYVLEFDNIKYTYPVVDVEGKITKVYFQVTTEEPDINVQTQSETEPEVVPDEVEDSGLPEGEFSDEILTQGKKNEPGWFKRLLTREKTELMKNLKSLQEKFIKINNLYFKINKVKVSSERQNVIVFSCKQQKLNADMMNNPKFKFFGNKDYFFTCRDSADNSFFYESNSKNIYRDVYYGTSSEQVKDEENDLRDFVFENICKKLNPSD